MNDFWWFWVAHEVKRQWGVYRGKTPFPGVVRVDHQLEPYPAFLAHLNNGEVFQVVPSGIAKPVGPLAAPTA